MNSAIYKNGNILTMESPRPQQAVAVDSNSRIQAVGSNDDVSNLITADTQVIDLHGQTLIPGFNDCHMHILPYGLDLSRADLSPQAGVRDIPSMVLALRGWADENSNAGWVL